MKPGSVPLTVQSDLSGSTVDAHVFSVGLFTRVYSARRGRTRLEDVGIVRNVATGCYQTATSGSNPESYVDVELTR
jgi:hypothetical protein